MKKSKTQLATEVFEEALNHMFKEHPECLTQRLAQLIASFLPEVLGTYYQFVDKITLADDILFIYVKTPAAKQAFGQNVNSICERLNLKLETERFKISQVRIC